MKNNCDIMSEAKRIERLSVLAGKIIEQKKKYYKLLINKL
jgi:hypothetical protein